MESPIHNHYSVTDVSFDSERYDIDAVHARPSYYAQENAATQARLNKFSSPAQELEYRTMRTPIDGKHAYAIFGMMLGFAPPTALFSRLWFDSFHTSDTALFLLLGILATATTSCVGYHTGKMVATAMRPLYGAILPNHLVGAATAGFIWGAVSGAVGGIFLFIFGAIVAAVIGAIAGAVATPLFSYAYGKMQINDRIELRRLMPFAVGIPAILAALILGAAA
jgi:hypothetical protein